MGVVFQASSSAVVSLDCLLSGAGLPLAIKRSLVYLATPVVLLAAVILVQEGIVRPAFRLLHKPFQYARSVVATVSVLVVMFFFYPQLVRLSLSFFACLPLDRADSPAPHPEYTVANASHGYWVYDIQQPCYKGWHLVWALAMGVPCVLLFCFGVPAVIALSLCINRSRLQSQRCKAHVGFLYHNYKESRFYWEVVSTLQLGLLVAIAVFTFTLGAHYSALLLLVLFTIMLFVTYACRPLAFRALHRAQLTSLGLMLITVMAAMSLFEVDTVTAPELYGDIIGVIVAVANVAYMLWCLFKAVVLGSSALRKWLLALGSRLGVTSEREDKNSNDLAPTEGFPGRSRSGLQARRSYQELPRL
jgi:hypothetical protein